MCSPRKYTSRIRRVFVMSSSGFASSTMKSRALARRDGACVGEPHELRRRSRRRHDDLRRRHAGRDHVGHLEMRPPRDVAVGAERDLDAFAAQALEVARLDRRRTPAPPDDRGCGLQLRDLSAGKLEASQLMSCATPRSGRFGTTTKSAAP